MPNAGRYTLTRSSLMTCISSFVVSSFNRFLLIYTDRGAKGLFTFFHVFPSVLDFRKLRNSENSGTNEISVDEGGPCLSGAGLAASPFFFSVIYVIVHGFGLSSRIY